MFVLGLGIILLIHWSKLAFVLTSRSNILIPPLLIGWVRALCEILGFLLFHMNLEVMRLNSTKTHSGVWMREHGYCRSETKREFATVTFPFKERLL